MKGRDAGQCTFEGIYAGVGWGLLFVFSLLLSPWVCAPMLSFLIECGSPAPLHFDTGVKIYCRAWPWAICNEPVKFLSALSALFCPGVRERVPSYPSGGWLAEGRGAVGISFPPKGNLGVSGFWGSVAGRGVHNPRITLHTHIHTSGVC